MTSILDQDHRRAAREQLVVIDSSSVASVELLRDRALEASRSGRACVLKVEEQELESLGSELQTNPMIDFVVKPVSEQALTIRLTRLAESVGVLADNATEIEQVRAELDRLCYYDQITDLPNYEFFRRHLTFQLRHAERYRRQLAVLAIDLGSLGRLQGVIDQSGVHWLLAETSRRLVEELRSYDVVGQAPQMVPLPDERMLTRLEGDRFLVLLSEVCDVKDVTAITGRLLDAISEPVEVAGQLIRPLPKVGVSLYPDDGASEDTLIQNAISALEFSDDHRLGRLGFFAESMNDKIADRIALEMQLRAAIENQDFHLAYQPKISLQTGKVAGLEALIRWQHPSLGNVSPAQFIPLAEELGLINEITRWVVQEVCAQIRRWRSTGANPPSVAVNLSGQDFLRAGFANFVTEQLLEYEVAPRGLEFEITESAVIENIDASTRILEDLRYIGVRISLDDFGTGYSSLSYLQRMPIDTVKIDRSFIRNITSDWNSAAVTSGIITLSHVLSLKVVAEGVETAEQIQLLKDQHCNEVQGAYFSMPVSADEALSWM